MPGHPPPLEEQQQIWFEQQAALAEFGRCALLDLDLDRILRRACELVGRGLRVPIAKVLEALPDGRELRIRAAVGVPSEIAGVVSMKVPANPRSAAGHAFSRGEPVICHVPTETRFQVTEVARRCGVVVSATVQIRSQNGIFGSPVVHSLEERMFTRFDMAFLQNGSRRIR
jgi:hypothetical protein